MSELCLTTQGIDEGERVEYWRDAIRSTLNAEFRIEPLQADFAAAMRVLSCGPAQLIAMQGSAHRTRRHGPGRPGWVSVIFQTGGVCTFADDEGRVQLAPGDACIVPPERDIVGERLTPFAQILLNVPAAELDERLPEWGGRLLHRIPAECASASAVGGLLRFIVGHHPKLDGGDRERLGATALHLLEGLRSTPAAKGCGGAPARLADYHRRRIEDWLRGHLRESDLCVARLTLALGLSPRYVHKLYAGRPHGVMGWVREQRLVACRRELAARGRRSIADIAGTWGFESAAHFSRAFRKRYGISPSEV